MENTNQSIPIYTERKSVKSGGVSGSVYGLAFIGALIYYMQHAVTFGAGVLGVLKAIVWQAVLVYNLMDFLKM